MSRGLTGPSLGSGPNSRKPEATKGPDGGDVSTSATATMGSCGFTRDSGDGEGCRETPMTSARPKSVPRGRQWPSLLPPPGKVRDNAQDTLQPLKKKKPFGSVGVPPKIQVKNRLFANCILGNPFTGAETRPLSARRSNRVDKVHLLK